MSDLTEEDEIMAVFGPIFGSSFRRLAVKQGLIPSPTDADTNWQAVYTIRDTQGVVLYVGISLQAAERIGTHANERGWWRSVRNIEIEHVKGRRAALNRETHLIALLRPYFNIARGTIK